MLCPLQKVSIGVECRKLTVVTSERHADATRCVHRRGSAVARQSVNFRFNHHLRWHSERDTVAPTLRKTCSRIARRQNSCLLHIALTAHKHFLHDCRKTSVDGLSSAAHADRDPRSSRYRQLGDHVRAGSIHGIKYSYSYPTSRFGGAYDETSMKPQLSGFLSTWYENVKVDS